MEHRRRYSMKPRDTQRSKVYAAEKVLFGSSKKFESVKDVEKYLRRIFDTVWFKKTFPHKRKFQVKDGRGRSGPSGAPRGADGVTMSLPKWSRFESMILHELAHGLTPREYAWHGPEFCAVFLRLVDRFMGAEAHKALMFSFRDHNVRSIWFKPEINDVNELLGLPPAKQELFKF